jgi:hypothetical protein
LTATPRLCVLYGAVPNALTENDNFMLIRRGGCCERRRVALGIE